MRSFFSISPYFDSNAIVTRTHKRAATLDAHALSNDLRLHRRNNEGDLRGEHARCPTTLRKSHSGEDEKEKDYSPD